MIHNRDSLKNNQPQITTDYHGFSLNFPCQSVRIRGYIPLVLLPV